MKLKWNVILLSSEQVCLSVKDVSSLGLGTNMANVAIAVGSRRGARTREVTLKPLKLKVQWTPEMEADIWLSVLTNPIRPG